ncbi:amidohydrolase [Evansella cellulosilytica]|uniref:Amidohydrolase 3 n=1 Tax=Evansella cellulosilytica (strain ATCC 21833 / DSM 2522 / FERM P-1141 / JCM 9156 / N-4) TaxID=649639 RepID=E6U148_EVAC2|nr:amidohydrolase [Evansella cellulosilytica]ADU31494.1 Amidohydrolase 3 [Evansella cellulosilytica DSM 2522]
MGTLWFGGKIRTLISENDVQEAIFVEDGRIIDVGQKEELIEKYKGRITKYNDLNNSVMYPGFVDSHLHMIGHGEKIIRLDLSSITSIEELKKTLKKAVNHLPENSWVYGEGFNENLYDDQKIPDRFILDEVTTKHPVILTRVCRHAVVTNTLGLNIANITASTPDPPGGVVVKDSLGNPTGYLLDQAQEYLKEMLPKQDFAYVKKALQTSLDDLYAKGFVGGHTEDLNYYGDPIKTLQTFEQIIDGKNKKFRANLLIHHEVASEILDYAKGKSLPFIELGSVKVFADGALGGRTALLSEPYSDDPSTNGVAIYTPEMLAEIVKNARHLNMPVAIHVIGDLALEYALDAIEKYPVEKGKRDRLIHLQVTREDLIQRLTKLDVVLDIQPRFVASDFPWVEDRLGESRLPYSFAWKRLLSSGLKCAGGSDAPIEPVDPLLGIHAAVTRRKPDENHDGYGRAEKLSLFEALRLFTVGSAEAISKEDERGLIKKGFLADFTILNKDLFDLEPDEWLQVEVDKTVVDNTIMYEK